MKPTDEAKIKEIIKDESIANFLIRLGDESLKWYSFEPNGYDPESVLDKLIYFGTIYNHLLETINIAVEIENLGNEFKMELRNIFKPDNLYSECNVVKNI